MSTHRNQKTQLAISSNRPYASPPKGFLSGWVQRHLVASHWSQWTLPPYTTQPAMQQQIHPLPTPPRPGWWQHQRNSNWPLHGLKHFFHVLFEPRQTPLKSTEVAQMAIQDSHLKVENSKWWPMGNWWFISSCSRSRWISSQVGNSKTSSSFDGDQQPRNNEHYLHIGHIQCWPT